jgi:hypothetical protein
MPSLSFIETIKKHIRIRRRLKTMYIPKTLMEKFLDEFLVDNTIEEVLEMIDVDIYDVLELAYEDGLIDGELVERLL